MSAGLEFLNRSSRREEAHAIAQKESHSLLTSTATRVGEKPMTAVAAATLLLS